MRAGRGLLYAARCSAFARQKRDPAHPIINCAARASCGRSWTSECSPFLLLHHLQSIPAACGSSSLRNFIIILIVWHRFLFSKWGFSSGVRASDCRSLGGEFMMRNSIIFRESPKPLIFFARAALPGSSCTHVVVDGRQQLHARDGGWQWGGGPLAAAVSCASAGRSPPRHAYPIHWQAFTLSRLAPNVI